MPNKNSVEIEFIVRKKLENLIEKLYSSGNIEVLFELHRLLELIKSLPVEVNFWHIQNIYYKIAKSLYIEFLLRSKEGGENAKKWVASFKYIGEMLFFNIPAILPE